MIIIGNEIASGNKQAILEQRGEGQPKARVKLPEFLNDVNPIFYEFSVWEVPGRRLEGGMILGEIVALMLALAAFTIIPKWAMLSLTLWLGREPF